jgi:acyl carrier protein
MKRDEVKTIMAKVFKLEVAAITDTASQQTLAAWDSLAHLNLIVELESAFDVSFEPEEIGIMTTLDKVEELLTTKL